MYLLFDHVSIHAIFSF